MNWHNSRLSLTNVLRDGHAPVISERIANKGLSAGAYADNWNVIALAYRLEHFRGYCTGIPSHWTAHRYNDFVPARMDIRKPCASSVRDASLDCTDGIFAKCIILSIAASYIIPVSFSFAVIKTQSTAQPPVLRGSCCPQHGSVLFNSFPLPTRAVQVAGTGARTPSPREELVMAGASESGPENQCN
ncbi:Uncharacterized protein DBV15_06048, partial [Temnothorax longispinosus]